MHARLSAHQGLEPSELIVLDIDEVETGCVGWQLLLDLALHVALDQCDRGQRGKAQTDRQQQLRCRGAGPVEVAHPQTRGRPGQRRGSAGEAHDQRRAGTEQHQGQRRGSTEIQREAAIGRGGDGQPDQRGGERQVRGDQPGRRARAFRHQGVTKQRTAWNPRCPAQRPEGEAQRGQQSVNRPPASSGVG